MDNPVQDYHSRTHEREIEMSKIYDIADAIKASLVSAPAGTFSQTLDVLVSSLPQSKREDLIDCMVTITPREENIEQYTRKSYSKVSTVVIGIQKLFDNDMTDAVRELTPLSEEILKYLYLKSMAGASFVSANRDIIVPEAADQSQLFVSIIEIQYQSVEDV